MRKLLFATVVLALGISSAANAQTTYTITGGNFDSYASWNTNATGTPTTLTYDNGVAAPAAVLGGTPGAINWSPSNPPTQSATYSGTITTDAMGNVTGGQLVLTGVMGYEVQVANNSWWYNQHTNMVIDFGTATPTSTYSCFETVVAPATCAAGGATPAANIFAPLAGNEGAAGAARPAATFDGTTLLIFHEAYAGVSGTDYLTTWTLTATTGGGGGGPRADLTDAGDVAGVGRVALLVTGVTSGAGAEIFNAGTGASLSTIEFFDTAATAWTPVAIDTLWDGNSNGVDDDPAIAMLAQNDVTGRIVVQTRLVSNGSKVGAGQVPFFNNSNWTPIDVAIVNDINGDQVLGDAGIAVLAQSTVDGRYEVRMKLLSNGMQTFSQRYFTPAWTATAVESYLAPGGGDARISVMATDAGGATVARTRQVSNGASNGQIFGFGSEISAADLAIAYDSNSDGVFGDTALIFYGKRVSSGNTVARSRDTSTGAQLKTKEFLGTGFTPDSVTTLSSANANGFDDIAGTATNGSSVLSIKVRDYKSNFSLTDILP